MATPKGGKEGWRGAKAEVRSVGMKGCRDFKSMQDHSVCTRGIARLTCDVYHVPRREAKDP